MGRYVFGPVSSRRLGLSLGVDLVKAKTCSMDCIYCEAGATTRLTLERSEAVPAEEVIAELRGVLSGNPVLDFVTFSGAGEPTLHSRIGEIIRFLKTEFPRYKVCLLTNACGFTDPGLRKEVSGADVVIPSLDASSEEEFQAVNRPVPGLTFSSFLEGLRLFCRESTAEIDLELFIVPGVNDSPDSVRRFAEILSSLKINKVQLNSLDRPGTDKTVRPVPPETMIRFIRELEKVVPVEAAGRFRYKSAALRTDCVRTKLVCRILELASGAPVEEKTLALRTGAELELLRANLEQLEHAGLLASFRDGKEKFYRSVSGSSGCTTH